MKFNAEPRIEGALHHALAMHLKDFGGGESTHQRLANLCRIGAGLGCEEQCFRHGLYVESNNDLVRHLGRLAVAVATDKRDVLTHLLEQRLDLFKGTFGAAYHDGQ